MDNLMRLGVISRSLYCIWRRETESLVALATSQLSSLFRCSAFVVAPETFPSVLAKGKSWVTWEGSYSLRHLSNNTAGSAERQTSRSVHLRRSPRTQPLTRPRPTKLRPAKPGPAPSLSTSHKVSYRNIKSIILLWSSGLKVASKLILCHVKRLCGRSGASLHQWDVF